MVVEFEISAGGLVTIVEGKMVAEFEISAGSVMIVGTVGLYERSGAGSSGS